MSKFARNVAVAVSRSTLFARAVNGVADREREQPGWLRVLTYHRVDDSRRRPLLYPRVTIAPSAFEAQMQMLSEHYRPVGIPRLLEALAGGDPAALPPRAVLVTFDDAYHDFAEVAWPIMQRYEIPAALFVATAFPGEDERLFWWDQVHCALETTEKRRVTLPTGELSLVAPAERAAALTAIREHVKAQPHEEAMAWVSSLCAELGATEMDNHVLGWDALRGLARAGVALGAHTRTHPLMNRISPAAAEAEVLGSLRDLRREIGETPPIFAYPSGGFNEDVVAILREAGIVAAFTTRRGVNELRRADPLRLRRINVGPNTSLGALRAQMLGSVARLGNLVGSAGL